MFSFGLKNLRRLRNVEAIEIKPITILVGRNSSGKSSFLRTLPLLRQSIATRTSSPILWYGDFVDFGAYRGAVSDNDLQNNMSFIFGVDNLRLEQRRFVAPGSYPYYTNDSHRFSAKCEVSLRSYQDTAQLCQIKIETEFGDRYEAKIGNKGEVTSLLINDESCLDFFNGIIFLILSGSIFPYIFASVESTDVSVRSVGGPEIHSAAIYLSKLYKKYLDKRLKDEAIAELCIELLLEPNLDDAKMVALSDRIKVRSWAKLLRDIGSKDSKKLYEITMKVYRAIQVVPLFRATGDRLREIISGVLYIGPARARSERYYRYQDLAVSEIDSDGKNFPMFLNSLRDAQFRNFSAWVESLFGYKLELTKSPGHISISVVEGDSVTNVVDTGYGVSQILPVLGQIWWAANKPRDQRSLRKSPTLNLLVIEQPELHLHPAHQAFLADAFVSPPERPRTAQSRTSGQTCYIIETHSETLVNRLGQLIGEGKVSSDDVQILLFEPSEDEDRKTEVTVAKFGDEGELINWPFGFFQPSV